MTNVTLNIHILSINEFVELHKLTKDGLGIKPALALYTQKNLADKHHAFCVIGNPANNVIENLDLSNEDLSYFTFININFKNCNLNNTDFSHCLMRLVNFENTQTNFNAKGLKKVQYHDDETYSLEKEIFDSVDSNYQNDIFEAIFNNNREKITRLEEKKKPVVKKDVDYATSIYKYMMPKGFIALSVVLGLIVGIRSGFRSGFTTFLLGSCITIVCKAAEKILSKFKWFSSAVEYSKKAINWTAESYYSIKEYFFGKNKVVTNEKKIPIVRNTVVSDVGRDSNPFRARVNENTQSLYR
ncbi:MAG: pentapeptide repeat-containing protein [Alphaproteobacteria bacterium]|jgi:hypothetical protein|nr:pentapeptide repeat-containing protein [Alphaproteobacteria bacterium]OJV12542.1 MAG: hypothetical protein BGO27_03360 [Alphaproteobacteria bacterium 33-17]